MTNETKNCLDRILALVQRLRERAKPGTRRKSHQSGIFESYHCASLGRLQETVPETAELLESTNYGGTGSTKWRS